ncbi:putative RING-H2 finger protein ATL63-like [Sesbania bispinosa]|nr:putative RING-H2 finger protein ATL63-like [Sesbania bispinosa]
MLNQSDSPNSPTNPLSQLARKMFSDDDDNNNSIMLAAIISLLLVILFVLLLHVYAKWFLSHAHAQSQSQARRRRRRRRAPVTVSGVPGPSQFHQINIETSPISSKGLDSAIVSAIPMFVIEAEAEEETEELECVICLSTFEEGEIGRTPIDQNDSQLGSVDDGVVEIVIDTPSYESERGRDSSSETSLSLLGCSLKRMLSKVFLSSHVNQVDGSE